MNECLLTYLIIINKDVSTTISLEDMIHLLESLKITISDHHELQHLAQLAKDGKALERDTLMDMITAILAADTEHLKELTNSIGDFEIQLK
ncbi:uncharacterized protein BX663DRAFT_433696 [Cokeromyces recurvatus]|uniref:uncharacterized protein n=1 Tax=Cokeromyces recurvatus TaxID=90255 RepID=UPI00221FD241|nr:uncharacterized protein BX663DRAFT_433696 [Cokeromyces recurvatus]KAI7903273.1 hypothetical protein BX663DRAFT_433696 [Cokeromyces recurvatus]